jgi:hypothetical protein
MELNLSNATRVEDVFSWDIPFASYKIQTITVTTDQYSFSAIYNDGVDQYLQSGRPDSCPAIFIGPFSVFFQVYSYAPPISNVQSINIILEEIPTE